MTEGAATGGGPPLSMGLAGGPSLGRVRSWLARQAALQAGRAGLWVPVGLGCGAAIYFSLPREPLAAVGVSGLCAAGVLALLARASSLRPYLPLSPLPLASLRPGLAPPPRRTCPLLCPITTRPRLPTSEVHTR